MSNINTMELKKAVVADIKAKFEAAQSAVLVDYRGLTVRVAGYTAYFTELARDLQDEIIARTTYESV